MKGFEKLKGPKIKGSEGVNCTNEANNNSQTWYLNSFKGKFGRNQVCNGICGIRFY